MKYPFKRLIVYQLRVRPASFFRPHFTVWWNNRQEVHMKKIIMPF